jgi:DNA-binding MarR family transcriptional regulator
MQDDSRLGGDFTLALFKLSGQMLAAGETLAQPAGITVAWWQVLGAVLGQPRTAPDIARQMGITRQAVQRVANRLMEEGLLDTLPNPAHKRSPLLTPTQAGRDAVERIRPGQTAFSQRIARSFGRPEFEHLVAELQRMSAVIDEVEPD